MRAPSEAEGSGTAPSGVVLRALQFAVALADDDGYAEDALVPRHRCEHVTNPERGACRFCEGYADLRAALNIATNARTGLADRREWTLFTTARLRELDHPVFAGRDRVVKELAHRENDGLGGRVGIADRRNSDKGRGARRADTAPPTAKSPAAPSTLAARSEPRYTRAEALTMAAEMLEKEAGRVRAVRLVDGVEDPRELDRLRLQENAHDFTARFLRARAEERSHEG